jgi:hypothetical protein
VTRSLAESLRMRMREVSEVEEMVWMKREVSDAEEIV